MSPLPGGQQPLHREFRRGATERRPGECPATRVPRDSICGSLDAAALKHRRLDFQHAAGGEEMRRRAQHARRAAAAPRAWRVGRQSAAAARSCERGPGSGPTAPPTRRAARDASAARRGSNSRITVEPMLKRPSSAPFSSARSGEGRRVIDAPRGGRDVARPDGGDAADVERPHQHHREVRRTRLRTASARARCARTAAARAARWRRSR